MARMLSDFEWRGGDPGSLAGTLALQGQAAKQMTEGLTGFGNVFKQYVADRTARETNDAIKSYISAKPEEREDLLGSHDANSWVDSTKLFDAHRQVQAEERAGAADLRAAALAGRQETEFGWKESDRKKSEEANIVLGKALADGSIDESEFMSASPEQRVNLFQEYQKQQMFGLEKQKAETALQTSQFNLASKQYDIAVNRREEAIRTAVRNGMSVAEAKERNPIPTLNYSGGTQTASGSPVNAFQTSAQPNQGVTSTSPQTAPEDPAAPLQRAAQQADAPAVGSQEQMAMAEISQLAQHDPLEASAVAEELLAVARNQDTGNELLDTGKRELEDSRDPIIAGSKSDQQALENKAMSKISHGLQVKYGHMPVEIVAGAQLLRDEINSGDFKGYENNVSPGTMASFNKLGQSITEFHTDLERSLVASGQTLDQRMSTKESLMKQMGFTDAFEQYEAAKKRIYEKQDDLSDDRQEAIDKQIETVEASLEGDTSYDILKKKVGDEGISKTAKQARKVSTLFKDNPPPDGLVWQVMATEGFWDDEFINNYQMRGEPGVEGDELNPHIALKVLEKAMEIDDKTKFGVKKITNWLSKFGHVGGAEGMKKLLESETGKPAETEDTVTDRPSVQPDIPEVPAGPTGDIRQDAAANVFLRQTIAPWVKSQFPEGGYIPPAQRFQK